MIADISVIYIVTSSAIFCVLHLNQTFGSPRSSIAEYKKDNEILNREKKLLETKKLEKRKGRGPERALANTIHSLFNYASNKEQIVNSE